MTSIELKISRALRYDVTYLPGSFDKKFTSQLKSWDNRPMTEKGRKLMIEIFHKYRVQIKDYETIKKELEENDKG